MVDSSLPFPDARRFWIAAAVCLVVPYKTAGEQAAADALVDIVLVCEGFGGTTVAFFGCTRGWRSGTPRQ